MCVTLNEYSYNIMLKPGIALHSINKYSSCFFVSLSGKNKINLVSSLTKQEKYDNRLLISDAMGATHAQTRVSQQAIRASRQIL